MNNRKALNGLPVLALIVTLALTGCANGIPKGTLSYYLPKAQTTLTVTQTLACNTAGDGLVQVVSVSPSTTYSSDTDHPQTITPHSISSRVTDADISFTFTNDGRLSGVNTATTGQGAAIVKDVLAVAKAAGATAATDKPVNPKKVCETIKAFAKNAKSDGPPPSLTLTYTRSVGYDTSDGTIRLRDGDAVGTSVNTEFSPDFASAANYSALQANIPLLGFDLDLVPDSTPKPLAPTWTNLDTADITLKLNALATAKLQIRGLKDNMMAPNREAFWSGEVLVPMVREQDLIQIPIPKPAFFGQRKFSLTLADNGAITKIGYVSTGVSDTADALGAIGSAVGATNKPLTTSQQAAALQAQADLIYQQQRLANCQAKPESCGK